MACNAPTNSELTKTLDAVPVYCSVCLPAGSVHFIGCLARSRSAYPTGTKSGGPEYQLSNTQPPDEPCGPCGEPALATKKLPGP